MATQIPCQFADCEYVAEGASEGIAIAKLGSHVVEHSSRPSMRPPPIDRPKIKPLSTEEEYNAFKADFERFKELCNITTRVSDQLWQCCSDSLKALIRAEDHDIQKRSEDQVLTAIYDCGVVKIATAVKRSNLRTISQAPGQGAREFYAKVRSYAMTCKYEMKCPHTCCASKPSVSYTDEVIKEQFIEGLYDSDIKLDVLENSELDKKDDKGVLQFVEEKEIAKKAITQASSTAALSSYSKSKKTSPSTEDDKKLALSAQCPGCQKQFKPYKRYQNGKLNR